MTDADDGENVFGSDDDEDVIGNGMKSKVELQTTNNVTNIFGSDDEDEVDEKWGRLQMKGDASPEEAANSNNNDNDNNDEGGGDLFGSDDEEDEVTSKDKKMPSRDDIMNYIVEVDGENQNDTKDWTIRQFLKALSEKVGFDLSEDKDIKSRVKDVINYFHDHRDKIMMKRSQGNTTGWLSADDDDNDDHELDDGLGVKGESYDSGYKDHYFKVKKKEKTISYLRLPHHNQILNTTSNSNTNSKLSYSKLPRDIKIQPSAFVKGKYDLQSELSRFEVLQPHQSLDDVENSKVGAEAKKINTMTFDQFMSQTGIIRWRYKMDSLGNQILDKDGLPKKESNAVIVEYKNGDRKIIVGEMTYDVSAHPVEKNASKFVYVTSKSTIDQHPTKKSSLSTHLCCVGMISDKVTLQNNILFRPAANVHPKTSKIKTFDEKFDPEKAKELKTRQAEIEAKKEEKRRLKRRLDGGGESMRGSYMNASFLEDGAENEMQYDSTSLKDLKKQIKEGKSDNYSSQNKTSDNEEDEIGSDDESFIDNEEEEEGSDDNEEDEEDDDDDDSDESDESEGVQARKKSKKDKKKEKKKEKKREKKAKKKSKKDRRSKESDSDAGESEDEDEGEKGGHGEDDGGHNDGDGDGDGDDSAKVTPEGASTTSVLERQSSLSKRTVLDDSDDDNHEDDTNKHHQLKRARMNVLMDEEDEEE